LASRPADGSILLRTRRQHTPAFRAFAESPEFLRVISDDTGLTTTQNYNEALNNSLSKIPGARGEVLRWIPLLDGSHSKPRHSNKNHLRDWLWNGDPRPTKVFWLLLHSGCRPADDQLDLVRWSIHGAGPISPQTIGPYVSQVKDEWACNSSTAVAGLVLVDGAKRDRAVWPSKLGIQGATPLLCAVMPSLLEILYG
jgi:hypothetical protein